MSNQSWCDQNIKGDTLTLHDMCSNLKCKCQKQINFNARQFQLEGSGFKISKVLEKCGIISLNLD